MKIRIINSLIFIVSFLAMMTLFALPVRAEETVMHKALRPEYEVRWSNSYDKAVVIQHTIPSDTREFEIVWDSYTDTIAVLRLDLPLDYCDNQEDNV